VGVIRRERGFLVHMKEKENRRILSKTIEAKGEGGCTERGF